uniref:Uncharacterized protein n=1 Tax=Zea mays TaxID=4577 RepID=A0A804MCS0_MAIZE
MTRRPAVVDPKCSSRLLLPIPCVCVPIGASGRLKSIRGSDRRMPRAATSCSLGDGESSEQDGGLQFKEAVRLAALSHRYTVASFGCSLSIRTPSLAD